jgi:FkbM family methyltransferase
MNFSGLSNQNLLGKILRQPLKLVPQQAAMPILQGRLKGKRWIAGSHTHGCWLGSYEKDKQRLFEAEVKPGSIVYDIGANAGFYTLLASELVGAHGRVFAFEPLPRNIRFLNEHLRLNQVINVDVIEAAVSDRSGETLFDDSAGSAMGHLTEQGKLKVRIVKIDDLVAAGEVTPPDCLKIDVEGAEAQVLSGAQSTLKNFHPKIFLATHGPEVHRACCSLLRSLNYQLKAIGTETIDECDEVLAS